LKSFPKGRMTEEDFELVTVEVPSAREGEVLVKNLWLSIEAGMRVMMYESDIDDIKDTVPGFHTGKPVHSFAVGKIIQSRNPQFPKGSYVTGMFNWQEYFTSSGAGIQIVDPNLAPVQYYLGVMGTIGAPAYFGLLDVGKIKAGETVVVSAAAGSVGSVARQVAKLTGCRVVGIAGSDEKVDWLLKEISIDAAINYKKVDSLQEAIGAACPDKNQEEKHARVVHNPSQRICGRVQ
jgi:NADPH-dependent curcumin reductase CurA